MSENIIIAIITASGPLLGAIIGAIATIIAASIKEKKGEVALSPSPLWKWVVTGAIVATVIAAVVVGIFMLLQDRIHPGTTLLLENFEDKLNENIVIVSGNWQIVAEGNNKIWDVDNTASSDYAGVNFGVETWKNYTIQYRVKMVNFVSHATPEFILYFRRNDTSGDSNVQAFTPDYNGSKLITLGKSTNYSGWQAISTNVFPFSIDKWYTFKVVAQDNRFKVYVDNKLVIDTTDSQISTGGFTLQVGPGAHVRFDEVLVSSND